MAESNSRIEWQADWGRRESVLVMRATVENYTTSHDHAFIEVAYVDKGLGRHEIGSQPEMVTSVRRGDLFVLNAGVHHRFVAEGDHPLVVYNCLFHPEALDGSVSGGEDFLSLAYRYLFYDRQGSMAASYIRLRDSAAACAILKEMYEECSRNLPGSALMNRANLTRLLLTIFRAYEGEIAATAGEKPSLFGRMIVSSTMDYLENHYGEDITCADLAKRVFVSPDYFGRMFKKAAGMSPIHALQKLRMENASRLLLETDMNVTDIARQVGYSDLKHFYHLFREHYATTPSRYRAEKGDLDGQNQKCDENI